MEQTLSLIANESFGDLPCSFYRQEGSEDILLTREQIGIALEYETPRLSIGRIHQRHKERMDMFSVRIMIDKGGSQFDYPPIIGDGAEQGIHQTGVSPSPDSGGEQETVLYNPKGVMEICRWSRQPKADAFMDFVWDVMDKLMRGEARLVPAQEQMPLAIKETNEKLESISAVCRELQTKVKRIEKTSAFSNYYLRLQARSGYDQRWERKAIRKVKAIAEFIGTEESQLLCRIYREMEQRYGIVLDDFVTDYKRVKKITRCSTLSVVSFSFPLREMFDAITNELCEVCGISAEDDGRPQGLVESIAESLAFHAVEAE